MLLMVCLCACDSDPYQGKRPINYPNTVWVCDEYDMRFSVNKDGKLEENYIVIQGEKYPLSFLWSALDERVSIKFNIHDEEIELYGKCKFSKNEFTIYVPDTKGYLKDSPATLVFKRVTG